MRHLFKPALTSPLAADMFILIYVMCVKPVLTQQYI